MSVNKLERALNQAGVRNVLGISLGNARDRSTWSVQWGPNATQADRAAATQVLATVDLSDPQWEIAVVDAQVDRDKMAQAILRVMSNHLPPTDTTTLPDLQVELKQAFRF